MDPVLDDLDLLEDVFGAHLGFELFQVAAGLLADSQLAVELVQHLQGARQLVLGQEADLKVEVWFAGWIGWNLGAFGARPFDPYPFGLLTMIVSLEAIFLSMWPEKSVIASASLSWRDGVRPAVLVAR